MTQNSPEPTEGSDLASDCYTTQRSLWVAISACTVLGAYFLLYMLGAISWKLSPALKDCYVNPEKSEFVYAAMLEIGVGLFLLLVFARQRVVLCPGGIRLRSFVRFELIPWADMKIILMPRRGLSCYVYTEERKYELPLIVSLGRTLLEQGLPAYVRSNAIDVEVREITTSWAAGRWKG